MPLLRAIHIWPQQIVKLTSRVDYFGILTLGTLNFFPTFYYGFYCDPRLAYIYMALMVLSGTSELISQRSRPPRRSFISSRNVPRLRSALQHSII